MQGFLFDLDQTLSNTAWPHRQVTERTWKALARLTAAGKKIGLCTGRQYAELKHAILPHFPADSLHVVGGGGEVVRQDGTRVWEALIPGDIVQDLVQVSESSGGVVVFGRGDRLYGTPIALEWKSKLGWDMEFGRLAELTDWSTPLICVQHITPQLREAVQNRPEITVKEMNRYDGTPYFDITAAGVTKALATEEWCRLQQIPLAEVTGFGDSENDLEFLQIIGTSLAVANAREEVKAAADQVIGHADEDGVAQYLESLPL